MILLFNVGLEPVFSVPRLYFPASVLYMFAMPSR